MSKILKNSEINKKRILVMNFITKLFKLYIFKCF